MNVSLRIEGVYAAYKKKEIIRGVSLSLRPGRSVALIGPNGAGKSTLLRIIAGFLEPSRGRVLLEDCDTKELAPHQRAQLGIGYLMQGGRVFSSLTVAENLELASSAASSRKRAQIVCEIAESLHLRTALDTKVGTLSGGWRQRLALAMVLARQPSLLLLDEPAAGLSPRMMHRVFETLEKYQLTNNAAILLVEQNVEAALSFAHRAVVLVNGRIAAQTNQPATWLVEGKLNSLFWRDTLQAPSGEHLVVGP